MNAPWPDEQSTEQERILAAQTLLAIEREGRRARQQRCERSRIRRWTSNTIGWMLGGPKSL